MSITVTDFAQLAAEALYDHWRRNSKEIKGWETASPELQQVFLDQVAALADAGLLLTGHTEWAWLTPSGYRGPGTEHQARHTALTRGGTAQFRIVPDPTPWRDA